MLSTFLYPYLSKSCFDFDVSQYRSNFLLFLILYQYYHNLFYHARYYYCFQFRYQLLYSILCISFQSCCIEFGHWLIFSSFVFSCFSGNISLDWYTLSSCLWNSMELFHSYIFHIKFQRVNDKCIMYALIQLNITTKELIQLNACRLYLKVSLISDITAPNRKIIMLQFLSGTKPNYSRIIFTWPNQNTPSKLAWTTW